MNNIYPKVTVMIPTYNQEKYIGKTIESVLMQDYPNLEIIVTDDFSTDKTGEVVKRYLTDPRLKYIRNHKNLGRVGNYHNTLYSHASGEWVINLDGDDYYTYPQYISKAMDRILKHPDVVCYFAKKYISPKLRHYHKYLIDKDCYIFDGKEFFMGFFKIGGFAHAGALYKRALAMTDMLCYTFPGIQSDFHGIIRYSVLGKVISAQDNGYYWRISGENATTSISNKAKYKSELKSQYAVIRDLPKGYLTKKEKEQWLASGKKWAKHQFIIDCLNLQPSFHSLIIAIANYRPEWGYTVIIIKSFLRMLGFNPKI